MGQELDNNNEQLQDVVSAGGALDTQNLVGSAQLDVERKINGQPLCLMVCTFKEVRGLIQNQKENLDLEGAMFLGGEEKILNEFSLELSREIGKVVDGLNSGEFELADSSLMHILEKLFSREETQRLLEILQDEDRKIQAYKEIAKAIDAAISDEDLLLEIGEILGRDGKLPIGLRDKILTLTKDIRARLEKLRDFLLKLLPNYYEAHTLPTYELPPIKQHYFQQKALPIEWLLNNNDERPESEEKKQVNTCVGKDEENTNEEYQDYIVYKSRISSLIQRYPEHASMIREWADRSLANIEAPENVEGIIAQLESRIRELEEDCKKA